MTVTSKSFTAKIVGKNLRSLRASYGFTQKTIANELGVSFQQVQKYETGQNKLPIENLLFLKQFYNVNFETFFVGLHGDKLNLEKGVSTQSMDEKLILKRLSKVKNPSVKIKILRLIDIMMAE